MNIFRTPETPRPIHLDFPAALLKTDLTSTEMVVYMLLLNRSNLSARRAGWTDGEGRVFVVYPVAELAEALGKSEAGVKKALNGLEKKDLIARRQQGQGKPSRIFLKLPQEESVPGLPETEETGAQAVYERSSQGVYERSSQEGYERSSQEGYGRSPQAYTGVAPRNKNREIYTQYSGGKRSRRQAEQRHGPTLEEYERTQAILRRLEKLASSGSSS